MFSFHASIASTLATDKPTGGLSYRVTNARISHSSSMNGSPASPFILKMTQFSHIYESSCLETVDVSIYADVFCTIS